ncbi:MAG: AMP-binding protein [Okeania sp. SIO3B5]|uniref:AMP-binding protein n=1 Tax=Okeania sp. SIO3B5 TaxID=2607811 RepID=UPI0014001A37|nr:AMP-binding protein [Okeania sp. SIO3B5]NEO58678.1 AMP-binding protein [Okeania sp. SIO3B5]
MISYLDDSKEIKNYTTIIEILRYRALHQAQKIAYIFLEDGEKETAKITYQELDEKARVVAFNIKEWKGERALLLYPSGLEFIIAFLGCLYAGVIAIPVYPPRRNHNLSRLIAIVEDSTAKLVLIDQNNFTQLKQKWEQELSLSKLKLIATDEIENQGKDWIPEKIEPNNIAYLQYTSGSTGNPKGVIVTHKNIIINNIAINKWWELKEDGVMVTWLPIFHDMGLIFTILNPLYKGSQCVLMPPVTFVQKPVRWLEAISKYKGTHSAAPNFAYELSARKITPSQKAKLDLSSWEMTLNGSEPLKANVIEEFVKTFAENGFSAAAISPGYGLAEATLVVSAVYKKDLPIYCYVDTTKLQQNKIQIVSKQHPNAQTFVGCGYTETDTLVRIVNPETCQLSQLDEIGEIWVSGSTIAQGYWQRKEATEETFKAYIKETGEGPFLRTGDLGFIDKGELFVTGRIKDLIIIRGRNYYPQDIEWTVENSHSGLRNHFSAAFSIEIEGEEQLAIACEVERTYIRKLNVEEVAAAIRHQVWLEHELKVSTILLLKTATIPKTSSGKIQRRGCREKWLKGELDLVGEWQQESKIKPLTNEKDSIYQESKLKADRLIEWLRQYAAKRINSRLIDERRCIPPYIVIDFANQGLLSLQVESKYGGLGLNHQDTMRVLEQLGGIDLSLSLFVVNHNLLGVRPLMKSATNQFKQELLSKIVNRKEIIAFALTEAGAGSNPRSIISKAIYKSEGKWLLEGEKIWIGSASWASFINVFVQQEDEKGQLMGISGFIVPQNSENLENGKESLTMGMRGMVQNGIIFKGVEVQEEQLLGKLGKGMEIAQEAMMYTRLGLAAICLGAMKRCSQLILRYSSQRIISTGCLLDNPVTLVRLNQLKAAITAIQSLVYGITKLLDEGFKIPAEIYTACKTSAPELLWKATDDLVQSLGGRGYIETNIAPQILRDARVIRIFEGPTEALNMFLGSRIFHQASELYQFLTSKWNAVEIVQKLNLEVEQVKEEFKKISPFREHENNLRWIYICLGELVTWAILLAAVKAEEATESTSSLNYAEKWLRYQWQQKVDSIFNEISVLTEISEAETLTKEIGNYVDSIGDIEQTLAGENHKLDSLISLQLKEIKEKVDVQPINGVELQQELNSKIQNSTESLVRNQNQSQTIEQWLMEWLAKQPEIAANSLNLQKSFADYGMDSVMSVELISELENWLNKTLDVSLLWNYPNVQSLAQYLSQYLSQEVKLETEPDKTYIPPTKNLENEKTLTDSEVEIAIASKLSQLKKLLNDN